MALGFKKNNQGFTLIELLVVIAIIGLLATLATVTLSVANTKAKISNAQHGLDQILKALVMMQNDTGEWPGHQAFNESCTNIPGGCPANNEICGVDVNANACVNSLLDDYSGLLADHTTPYPNWAGPYMTANVAEDPWGNEYFFDTDYSVDSDDNPCSCSNIGCHDVVALGSYGPDEEGVPAGGIAGAYGCDDIILIVER